MENDNFNPFKFASEKSKKKGKDSEEAELKAVKTPPISRVRATNTSQILEGLKSEEKFQYDVNEKGLLAAIGDKQWEAVEFILKEGGDALNLNATDEDVNTFIIFALRRGNISLALKFLKEKATITFEDFQEKVLIPLAESNTKDDWEINTILLKDFLYSKEAQKKFKLINPSFIRNSLAQQFRLAMIYEQKEWLVTARTIIKEKSGIDEDFYRNELDCKFVPAYTYQLIKAFADNIVAGQYVQSKWMLSESFLVKQDFAETLMKGDNLPENYIMHYLLLLIQQQNSKLPKTIEKQIDLAKDCLDFFKLLITKDINPYKQKDKVTLVEKFARVFPEAKEELQELKKACTSYEANHPAQFEKERKVCQVI